jgi:DNA-binding transcriptional regulator LsrR (DeoR family)
MNGGLSLADLARRHGMSPLRMRRLLEPAVAAGLVRVVGDVYATTPEGDEATEAVTPLVLLLELWRAQRRDTARQGADKAAA